MLQVCIDLSSLLLQLLDPHTDVLASRRACAPPAQRGVLSVGRLGLLRLLADRHSREGRPVRSVLVVGVVHVEAVGELLDGA